MIFIYEIEVEYKDGRKSVLNGVSEGYYPNSDIKVDLYNIDEVELDESLNKDIGEDYIFTGWRSVDCWLDETERDEERQQLEGELQYEDGRF